MCHRRTPLTRRGRTVPQLCSVPITEEVKMATRMRPRPCPKTKEKTMLPGEVIRLNKSPSCSCWFAYYLGIALSLVGHLLRLGLTDIGSF